MSCFYNGTDYRLHMVSRMITDLFHSDCYQYRVCVSSRTLFEQVSTYLVECHAANNCNVLINVLVDMIDTMVLVISAILRTIFSFVRLLGEFVAVLWFIQRWFYVLANIYALPVVKAFCFLPSYFVFARGDRVLHEYYMQVVVPQISVWIVWISFLCAYTVLPIFLLGMEVYRRWKLVIEEKEEEDE